MTKNDKPNGRAYKDFSGYDKKLLAILGIGIGSSVAAKKQIVKMNIKIEGKVNYNFIKNQDYKSGDIDLSTIKNEPHIIDDQITITPNTLITTDIITKAYRATQKIFHPDKCKKGPICESITQIHLELDAIKELLLTESGEYHTTPISISLSTPNLLKILSLSYLEKYEAIHSQGTYEFKAKGKTTSNNNANNDFSKEQIEDNIAIIKNQKGSLQEAKKQVEDSIVILNKPQVHAAVARDLYDQVVETCRTRKIDQLQDETSKKQEVLTSEQMDQYSLLYTKQCEKDFGETYIQESVNILQQQLKSINTEIVNSDNYLNLLNTSLETLGNSGSSNNHNNQYAETKAKQEESNDNAIFKAANYIQNTFDHFTTKVFATGFSYGKFDCMRYKYCFQIAEDYYGSSYLPFIALGILFVNEGF